MIVRAKFASICYRCGTGIRPGHFIEITRGGHYGGEVARHAACQTEQEKAIAPFDPWLGRYVSPNGVTADTPTPEPRVAKLMCGTCGKPVEWVRPGKKPLCDSCQENARIEQIRRELEAVSK